MHILVTGSRGLIGSSLVPFLTAAGHRVTRLVRSPSTQPGEAWWDPAAGIVQTRELGRVEAVVHLAGESIATGRWTSEKKRAIRDSRVQGTRTLCEALAAMEPRPSTLVCASAIGYYGHRGDALITEQSPPGRGFLAEVCQAWEAAADPARRAGLRVVHARIGIVLSPSGGALAKMLPVFRLGLGGPFGSGRQWMSWIAIEDVAGALAHAVTTPMLEGPVNLVAPHPVTNRAFTDVLGRVVGRPSILPAPAFALRLALGEMADALLLSSARVSPEKLLAARYGFRIPTLAATTLAPLLVKR